MAGASASPVGALILRIFSSTSASLSRAFLSYCSIDICIVKIYLNALTLNQIPYYFRPSSKLHDSLHTAYCDIEI